MDDGDKMVSCIHPYLSNMQSILVLSHIEIEKYHKISEAYHKVKFSYS